MAKKRKNKRPTKKGPERKPHEFSEKNENGKNRTRPIVWTPQAVLEELEAILALLRADTRKVESLERGTIVLGYKYVYIGQVFVEREISRQCFSEWKQTYAGKPLREEDAEIFKKISDTIEIIEDIFLTRSWEGGLKGDLNPTITKLHLYHKFGVKDQKQEVEHSGGLEITQKKMIQDAIRRSKEVK